MQTFTAREAKQRFGTLLDHAQREPVSIEKHGRPVAVVLSHLEYERLEALEDRYWLKQAEEAEKEGFLDAEESEELIREILSAED